VVVANAGISGPTATTSAVDSAAFEQVIDINLLGVWRTVRSALPHLRAGRGYVLIVSSIAAAIPTPTMPAYGTAKAGVEAFGRALAGRGDHRRRHVRAVHGGPAQTSGHRDVHGL